MGSGISFLNGVSFVTVNILVLTFSQIWPPRVPSDQLLGPCDMLPSFFEPSLVTQKVLAPLVLPWPSHRITYVSDKPWFLHLGGLGAQYVGSWALLSFSCAGIDYWSANLSGREGRKLKGGGWVRVWYGGLSSFWNWALWLPVSPCPLQEEGEGPEEGKLPGATTHSPGGVLGRLQALAFLPLCYGERHQQFSSVQ